MRPVLLQMHGFASFREPTTIDFTDADYFALVGPTGSGKSSIIDAIGFALYGSIPRYDDRRLVAPIISQGRVEARVGLDFALGDDLYRAVRVVRAGKGRGATTKEARLERLGRVDDPILGAAGTEEVLEVLAGDADGVSREVVRLLGLEFDQFTRCVVLPQGSFARFLHDKPADRQELLVRLLDLTVYERVAAAANRAAQTAGERIRLCDEMVGRPPLLGATPEAVAGAGVRATELRRVEERIRAAMPGAARLAADLAAAQATVADARDRVAVVAGLRAPPETAGLHAAAVEAAAAVESATASLAACAADVTEADRRLAALPARAGLARLVAAHEELAVLATRRANGEVVVAERSAAAAAATAAATAAAARTAAAIEGRDAAVAADHAAALAGRLQLGGSCPVCQQVVPVLPPPSPAQADLAVAEAAVVSARQAEAEAVLRREEAERRQVAAATTLADLLERSEILASAVVGQADPATLRDQLEALGAAEEALAAARIAEKEAVGQLRHVTGAAGAARDKVEQARVGFDAARDRAARLGPPPAGRRDLLVDWADLEAWASREEAAARTEGEQAVSILARLQAEASVARREVDEWCRAAAVAPTIGPDAAGPATLGAFLDAARQAVADAAGRAEHDRAALATSLAEAERLRAERDAAAEEAGVARLLAVQLGARGFEKWLLDEALGLLVEGATSVLGELSGGAYSLTLDGSGGFAVVDHRNADAVRSARTLSGGETFLASLALALALAARLTELAATSTARLEAIFLDEGFGTLDPDTLDTVAAAIESLAAAGRVVGIVTHVRELAERVPVRFEVSRGPVSSTVERVEG